MMSKDNRPRSWQEMRDRRASQNAFIGRENQIKVFREILVAPYNQRDRVIFNISGQGGIGKTTLLKQFRRIAQDLKQLTAYVDEGAQSNRVDDVPKALDRLAKDFEKQGHKFHKFQERYKTYRQKRQELEADPDAPQGFAAWLGRMLTKASLGAAKSIPGSGTVLDLVEADAVANKAGEYLTFIAGKLTNKDEVLLLREPLEVLTPLFLEDLYQIAQNQTVVLLLDTYEQTGAFLNDWLRSLLDGRYGDITPNFLLGIAGRDPLSRNIWAEFESWIVRSELDPFTQDETRQYLTNSGITNEAVIQEIWRLSSGGLPLLIGMMAQASPTSINVIVDPCEDAVERFLKWESDGTKRQLALNAALPRMLNQDILALLVDESAVNELFEWLKGRSFVVEHPEGWQYHNIVREQMLRYQRRISPKAWKEQHTHLAEYYEGLRKGLGLNDAHQLKNETWQKYTLEWLYHSLCANPLQQMDMVLNGWLTALNTSKKFAQEWAETMKMAGITTSSEDIKRWGQQFHHGLLSLEQKCWGEMVEILSLLLQENFLEDNCRGIALLYQGFYSLLYFIFINKNPQAKLKTNKVLNLEQINEVLEQILKLGIDQKDCLIVKFLFNIVKKDINSAKATLNQVIEFHNLDKDSIEIKEWLEFLLKEEELQALKEEQQKLENKLARLQKKIARRLELSQEIRILMGDILQQREEFQNLTEKILTKEELERLKEFFQRKIEEVQELAQEILIKREEPQTGKEEIKKLLEIFHIKYEGSQEVLNKVRELLEEYQAIQTT